MFIINCPHCGPREESEFACGGEAHIARPLAENTLTDAQFADYLFLRDNPKGLFLERWRHTAGCRRWFNVARDTVTDKIVEIYPMGSTPSSKPAAKTYADSWRRETAAERAAKPATAAKSAGQKASAKKAAPKKATAKKAAVKKAAVKKAGAKKASAKKKASANARGAK